MKTLVTGTVAALLFATAATAQTDHGRIGDPNLFGLVQASEASAGLVGEAPRYHPRIGDLALFDSPGLTGGETVTVEIGGAAGFGGSVEADDGIARIGDAASGTERFLR